MTKFFRGSPRLLKHLDVSPLLTGVIAAEVFVVGLILSGTAAAFKEAVRLRDVMRGLQALNPLFIVFAPKIQAGFATRLKSEQANIRKLVIRMDTMRPGVLERCETRLRGLAAAMAGESTPTESH